MLLEGHGGQIRGAVVPLRGAGVIVRELLWVIHNRCVPLCPSTPLYVYLYLYLY